MFHPNKPCPICGGSDRFYLITQPSNGSAPYWRCRQCDYTEPHDEDLGEVAPDHVSRRETRSATEIAEAHAAYTAVADYCADQLWTSAGAAALSHLRKRGLSDDTIRRARLGWCGDGAEMFTRLFYADRPAYDGAMTGGLRRRQGVPRPVCKYTITIPYWHGDTCVLLRGRKLVMCGNEPKYLSPAGPLYAGAVPRFYLHETLAGATSIILTEGELKALAAYQEWRAERSPMPCVATSGVMYLPSALIEALQGKVVYLAYDNEARRRGQRQSPGEAAIGRNGNKLRAAGITVKVIELPRRPDQVKVDLDSYIAAG